MNIKRLSIDLAKDVFQLYGVNNQQKVVLEKRIASRQKFVAFIAKISPCEIVMEACGIANYWARKFSEFGCDVKLIAPQYVKPYIQDFRDAIGIMEA